MTDAEERAVRLLLKALGSLSEREREVVLRYLLLRHLPDRPISFGQLPEELPSFDAPIAAQFDPVTRMLPVRLPAALHDRLRNWSTTNGFSMAAVVRGLIERFLDEREKRSK